MAPFLGIIVTLCGLTGTHSITTVSEVAVEMGATVSVPCLYELRHKNHVKYLCKGTYWTSCSIEIKTDSESSSPNGLYTISDDPDQGVFTVSIKSTEQGTQTYWCAVKIPGIHLDEKTYFKLLVSKGRSSLYVDQQGITGFEGDGMKISFYSQTQGKPGWCKLGHCKDQQEGYIEGSQVSIDTNKSDVFVVTMRDLHMESSGWYIFSQGQLNMPIRLTVAVRSTTTTLNTTTTNTTTSTTVSTLSEVVTTKESTDNKRSNGMRNNLIILLLPLGILLFLTSVALLVWWMFHRRAKRKRTAVTGSPETDVVYSNVMPIHSSTAQNIPTGDMNLKKDPQEGEDVTYSLIWHPRL